MRAGPARPRTKKELAKARALYIGHLLARMVCFAMITFFAYEFAILDHRMTSGDWIKYFAYLLVAIFAVELVLAPLFRRKARAWHLWSSNPPEDRWPRR